jgi:hypothetical protein
VRAWAAGSEPLRAGVHNESVRALRIATHASRAHVSVILLSGKARWREWSSSRPHARPGQGGLPLGSSTWIRPGPGLPSSATCGVGQQAANGRCAPTPCKLIFDRSTAGSWFAQWSSWRCMCILFLLPSTAGVTAGSAANSVMSHDHPKKRTYTQDYGYGLRYDDERPFGSDGRSDRTLVAQRVSSIVLSSQPGARCHGPWTMVGSVYAHARRR